MRDTMTTLETLDERQMELGLETEEVRKRARFLFNEEHRRRVFHALEKSGLPRPIALAVLKEGFTASAETVLGFRLVKIPTPVTVMDRQGREVPLYPIFRHFGNRMPNAEIRQRSMTFALHYWDEEAVA